MGYQNGILRKIEALDFLGAVFAVYRKPLQDCGLLPSYPIIYCQLMGILEHDDIQAQIALNDDNLIIKAVQGVSHIPPIGMPQIPPVDYTGDFGDYLDIVRWLDILDIPPRTYSKIIVKKSRNILHHYSKKVWNYTQLRELVDPAPFQIGYQVYLIIKFLLAHQCIQKKAGAGLDTPNNLIIIDNLNRFNGINGSATNFEGLGYWLNKVEAIFNGINYPNNGNQNNQDANPNMPPDAPVDEGRFSITYINTYGNQQIAYCQTIEHLETLDYGTNQPPTRAWNNRSLNDNQDNITNAPRHELYILEKGLQFKEQLITDANEELARLNQQLLFQDKDGYHYQIRITKSNGHTRYLPVINIITA